MPHPTSYVALSGGADSVALLLKLHEQGQSIIALHCNFHLRGEESDRDEAFCQALCQKLGITLKVKHFDTQQYAQQQHLSIEMAARELRYNWFATETDTICVAHHLDDQAETILLHLLRGTGINGLQGMKEESTQNISGKTLRIIRPLLGMTKAEILDYLKEHNQDFVTDSTNLERDALRNRIRLDLLPMMEQMNRKVKEHLASTAKAVTEHLSSTRHDLLFQWFSPLGFTPSQIDEMARAEITLPDRTPMWESHTHRALFSQSEWHIEKKRIRRQLKVDGSKTGTPLTYRPLKDGDRFRPFGMKTGSKLIKDFLAQRGFNLFERERQWVVLNPEGKIVAVSGVEIDNRYRISQDTDTDDILLID